MTHTCSTTTVQASGRTRIRVLASALLAVGTTFGVGGLTASAAAAQLLTPDTSPPPHP